MTDYAITKDWPDTISFDRLHALAARGYRAHLGTVKDQSGFARIDLFHPKTKGRLVPPKLTLWSNGILATAELLWPLRHVAQEDGTSPDWKKFIDASDEPLFRNFIDSVPKPSAIDLYLYPFIAHSKVFMARLLFGGMLCLCIGVGAKLVAHLARHHLGA